MSSSDLKTVPGYCSWRGLSKDVADKLSILMARKAAAGLIERRATRSKIYRGVRWSYHRKDIDAAYREFMKKEKVIVLDEGETFEIVPQRLETITRLLWLFLFLVGLVCFVLQAFIL